MKWHSKSDDVRLVNTFLQNLKEFQRLKLERWEKIDEQVQMSIIPGSPSEDWIIPPDEDKTLHILEKDPDYVRLRDYLNKSVPKIKECAKFVRLDTHHDYDWVVFTTPLIGNSALEDAMADTQRLLKTCQNSNYFCNNLIALIS